MRRTNYRFPTISSSIKKTRLETKFHLPTPTPKYLMIVPYIEQRNSVILQLQRITEAKMTRYFGIPYTLFSMLDILMDFNIELAASIIRYWKISINGLHTSSDLQCFSIWDGFWTEICKDSPRLASKCITCILSRWNDRERLLQTIEVTNAAYVTSQTPHVNYALNERTYVTIDPRFMITSPLPNFVFPPIPQAQPTQPPPSPVPSTAALSPRPRDHHSTDTESNVSERPESHSPRPDSPYSPTNPTPVESSPNSSPGTYSPTPAPRRYSPPSPMEVYTVTSSPGYNPPPTPTLSELWHSSDDESGPE